jgi:large subunit ribosomal protein L21
MEAIVEIAGFQYKVKENDKIEVPKVEGKEGDNINFPILMLMGDKNVVGTPYVEGAQCETEILGFGRSPKIIVYKYKSKKRYRRKKGHRQPYTQLLISKITV